MTIKQLEAITMDDITADEEFITAAEFEDATRTVVRTLGKNFDLDIIFAGEGAKTDGNIVTLPAQDPTKQMTKKQYAVGQGFANHETMHNLCTDLKHFTGELGRLKKEGKKLAASCANAIEDVRIERAAARLYPGIPSQISSTADYAAQKFLEDYLENDPDIVKDFKRIGPLAITWRGRQRIGYTSPYIDKCLSHLSPEMTAQLDKWCDMIENLETGATGPGEFDQAKSFDGGRKGVQLAELLAREIEETDDEDEEEPPPQGGDGSGDGDDDSQSNGGRGGGSGQQHNSGGDGNGAGDPLDPDMQQAVADLLKEGNDNRKSWRPISTALDAWVTRDTHSSRNPLRHPNNGKQYMKLLSEIGSRTAVMKRKLERALLTASEADYVSGQRAGRLDVRRRGVQIMQGAENIFRRKMEGKSVDTAVSIVVDASSSMDGSRMKLASQVCVALAEALEKTSVDLEIIAFQSGIGDGAEHSDAVRNAYHSAYESVKQMQRNGIAGASLFHRCEPVTIYELKAFEDNLRVCRDSLGAMPHLADGCTPDGDGMLGAAKRLLSNKKPKKIMLVLTDGGSGYSRITGNCEDYAKMAINFCTKMGITVVGVGIQSDHGNGMYKNWTVVNELADLDKAIIDNIARLILGENFKIDNADVSGAAQNFKRRA